MDLNIVTFIFFALAVVIFIQLRNVLGRRTGRERPPFDPFSAKAESREEKEGGAAARPADAAAPADPYAEIDAYITPDDPLNAGLRAIRNADGGFAPQPFLAGARAAYEMILTAFAKGDMAELRRLLADNIYQDFAKAVAEREKAGESVKFTFVGLDKAQIIAAELENGEARICVAFGAEIISATYDKAGRLIDGDAQDIFHLQDHWVFSRNVKAKTPDWLLAATQDDRADG